MRTADRQAAYQILVTARVDAIAGQAASDTGVRVYDGSGAPTQVDFRAYAREAACASPPGTSTSISTARS
ncbi:MAG: hypothetical protein U0166_24985 [Acidobacteriota bacterium]